jgi:hypothetical protein
MGRHEPWTHVLVAAGKLLTAATPPDPAGVAAVAPAVAQQGRDVSGWQ